VYGVSARFETLRDDPLERQDAGLVEERAALCSLVIAFKLNRYRRSVPVPCCYINEPSRYLALLAVINDRQIPFKFGDAPCAEHFNGHPILPAGQDDPRSSQSVPRDAIRDRPLSDGEVSDRLTVLAPRRSEEGAKLRLLRL